MLAKVQMVQEMTKHLAKIKVWQALAKAQAAQGPPKFGKDGSVIGISRSLSESTVTKNLATIENPSSVSRSPSESRKTEHLLNKV